MALKDLTLSSLESTKLKDRFAQAVEMVSTSLTVDKDVPGKRKIKVEIVFDPKNGYNITRYSAWAEVPAREEGGITIIGENGTVQVETSSNDARQPGLPLGEAPKGQDKVVSLAEAREQGRA